MLKEYAIGCDPGTYGCLCVYAIHEGSLTFYDFHKVKPVVIVEELVKLKEQGTIVSAAIEKVHALGKVSAKSTFRFGENYGVAKMLFAIAGISVDKVAPKEWQKSYSIIISKDLTPYKRRKALKEEVCRNAVDLFPLHKMDFRTIRGALIDGRSDSACIMYHNLKKLKEFNMSKDKSKNTPVVFTSGSALATFIKDQGKDVIVVVFDAQSTTSAAPAATKASAKQTLAWDIKTAGTDMTKPSYEGPLVDINGDSLEDSNGDPDREKLIAAGKKIMQFRVTIGTENLVKRYRIALREYLDSKEQSKEVTKKAKKLESKELEKDLATPPFDVGGEDEKPKSKKKDKKAKKSKEGKKPKKEKKAKKDKKLKKPKKSKASVLDADVQINKKKSKKKGKKKSKK